MKNFFLLVYLFAAVPRLLSQTLETETFLVPIAISRNAPVPGAHGSLWSSTLLFRNETSDSVEVIPHFRDCQGVACIMAISFPPNSTVELIQSNFAKAELISVRRRSPGPVHFNLRIRDLSRQSQTWGTEIPVVSEREFRAGETTFVGVPVTSGFRHTLRLYEVNGRFTPTPTLVRVRLFGTNPLTYIHEVPGPPPDTFLGEAIVEINLAPPGNHEEMPGYTEVHDLGQVASLEGWNQITVQIEPVTEGLSYWAFISVTNDQTQHVTVITPRQ